MLSSRGFYSNISTSQHMEPCSMEIGPLVHINHQVPIYANPIVLSPKLPLSSVTELLGMKWKAKKNKTSSYPIFLHQDN